MRLITAKYKLIGTPHQIQVSLVNKVPGTALRTRYRLSTPIPGSNKHSKHNRTSERQTKSPDWKTIGQALPTNTETLFLPSSRQPAWEHRSKAVSPSAISIWITGADREQVEQAAQDRGPIWR